MCQGAQWAFFYCREALFLSKLFSSCTGTLFMVLVYVYLAYYSYVLV